MNSRKKNGRFYTPEKLAEYLASLTIEDPDSKILDPCFGKGSLLRSSFNRIMQLGGDPDNVKLFGYDNKIEAEKDFHKRFPDIAKRSTLCTQDFFSEQSCVKKSNFDCILMNPPFVKHQFIENSICTKARKHLPEELKLPSSANLWAYFLIRSLKLLKRGGNIGVILPWSFLFNNFSKNIKSYLSSNFSLLKVLVLGETFFKNAEERVLILLGFSHGEKARRYQATYTATLDNNNLEWKNIEKKEWLSPGWPDLFDNSESSIYSAINKSSKFEKLENFAKVHIGEVTGANKFFIINENSEKRKLISDDYLIPALKKSKNLDSLEVNSSHTESFLMKLPGDKDKLTENLKRIIKKAEKDNTHQGYHCRNREHWFSLSEPDKPDAFMNYMTSEVPFISLNKGNLTSTNNIHHVFFKDSVSISTKKWIQISMFSTFTQLSVEMAGRIYGGGVLKIEPRDASNVRVYAGSGNPPPSDILDTVNNYLKNHNKEKAMEVADEFFLERNIIEKENLSTLKKIYKETKNRRKR